MLLANAPAKIPLPFASSGLKNTIPEASQIGITPGAASLTDGFPPLTLTPLASGGVPPSGKDMNGVLFGQSAVARWSNAGGGYVFDASFVADVNVGGYPKGARILRTDGAGYWLNTTDNNTTDPESAGAVAAGWVPDFTSGGTAVTMTNANVTLTGLQYGNPIIVITGTLTANLNLIFPNIAKDWIVINNTTGGYTVTCKTAAGTGVVVTLTQTIVGDGTNIYLAAAVSNLGVSAQVGNVSWYPANVPPANCIKANGSLLSRASYPALWAYAQASGNLAASDGAWLGGQFSPGDGSTTFRIPDLRGYHIRGFDDSRGIDAGRAIGTVQADATITHNHGVNDTGHSHGVTDPSHVHSYGNTSNIQNGGGSPSAFNAGSTGVTNASTTGVTIVAATTGITVNNYAGASETRVKNIALLACIKYQ